MPISSRSVAALGAITLAAPLFALTAAPANAAPVDVERQGACGAGRYEFSVDNEGRGFEISAGLDFLPRGQRWRVVLRHNGRVFTDTVRGADNEGEFDVERFRRGTAGRDTFAFAATRVGGAGSCSARITMR